MQFISCEMVMQVGIDTLDSVISCPSCIVPPCNYTKYSIRNPKRCHDGNLSMDIPLVDVVERSISITCETTVVPSSASPSHLLLII